METSTLIEGVERNTFLNLIEGVETALTAIAGKITPTNKTVFLTPDEVAERLNVSKVSVWSWTKKGLLKSYRIGNQIRYIEDEVIQAVKGVGKGGVTL